MGRTALWKQNHWNKGSGNENGKRQFVAIAYVIQKNLCKNHIVRYTHHTYIYIPYLLKYAYQPNDGSSYQYWTGLQWMIFPLIWYTVIFESDQMHREGAVTSTSSHTQEWMSSLNMETLADDSAFSMHFGKHLKVTAAVGLWFEYWYSTITISYCLCKWLLCINWESMWLATILLRTHTHYYTIAWWTSKWSSLNI